uniref:Uncharacterized protein n=1 Tax=Nymphaea colorata TaxID=210225 RepID=A0A5K1HDZ4_9MAGN|nr:unnamed protein product [Nymphaea colorata]
MGELRLMKVIDARYYNSFGVAKVPESNGQYADELAQGHSGALNPHQVDRSWLAPSCTMRPTAGWGWEQPGVGRRRADWQSISHVQRRDVLG